MADRRRTPTRADSRSNEFVGRGGCSDLDGSSYEEPGSDRNVPPTFSVYAHLKAGGIDCCGDFSRQTDALVYGAELASIHHWPVFDYTSYGPRENRQGLRRDALLTIALMLRSGCLQALEPLDRRFEDDRSAISAIRCVCEAGIAEIRRQLEANRDHVQSEGGTADGK